ncbi:MAG: AAA family ATPase, partial [Bacteroidota bacterium]
PSYDTLNKLADRYPFSKAVQRNISIGPDAAWEREPEIDQVVDKMLQTRSNILIIGAPGSGKSAVLQQSIKKVLSHAKSLKLDLTFWRILPQRITASAKYLGEWEETCERLVEELERSQGILWVISMIRLLEIGGSGPEDSVAAFFLPFLQQGKMQIIGEASPQELESMRRLLPNFVELFQIVNLADLEENQIHNINRNFAQYSEKNLRIQFDSKALDTSYRLLHRYYPYENFPGKSIKFLSQCINRAQINNKQSIDQDQVLSLFAEQTGLPELFLRDEQLLDEEDLHNFFHSKIIGQPQALHKMMDLVKIFKAGLNSPDRPISTLIFAGPTGVGKTASAKTLADYFFGKGQKRTPLIRIDMSEFRHPAQISRLIGSGQSNGQLIKEIRERPFSVLLLDEIEKADPSIFDALLTVLDEGILIDAFGRVTYFKNTIIIMTSNLGATNRGMPSFVDSTSREEVYQSAINRHFRPEFVNRIDGVVIFNPLLEDDIRKITVKELNELKQREGFTKKNIDVRFSQNVIDHISRIGFDERYGARPLQRAIEQSIVNPIANWILQNNKASNCKLLVDFDQSIRIKKL